MKQCFNSLRKATYTKQEVYLGCGPQMCEHYTFLLTNSDVKDTLMKTSSSTNNTIINNSISLIKITIFAHLNNSNTE